MAVSVGCHARRMWLGLGAVVSRWRHGHGRRRVNRCERSRGGHGRRRHRHLDNDGRRWYGHRDRGFGRSERLGWLARDDGRRRGGGERRGGGGGGGGRGWGGGGGGGGRRGTRGGAGAAPGR